MAFSVLIAEEWADYETVKIAFQKNYKFVPEAYRLKFRYYEIKEEQTYGELVKMKEGYFDRYHLARKIDGS